MAVFPWTSVLLLALAEADDVFHWAAGVVPPSNDTGMRAWWTSLVRHDSPCEAPLFEQEATELVSSVYRPAGHTIHDVAPVPVRPVLEPKLHCLQPYAVALFSFWYVPAEHALHAVSSFGAALP